ncbi:MAG: aminotransferase class IV family protein [Sulfuricurvum sp.]|uniref:aminotransferase class IV family protein n=1 Tax=Sulfuricurvum sp. TaxID=2025608 RepID=UPI0026098707|nr:aminotransferase class IV family protein [Sulfuricurvum sp.]MDD2829187.1 aminotransferase class IV family protein [Sulfuricurvum sp.]MDD4949020.1 aminotransferase class IV family protein [Sulfuricurvum sp.]
MKPKTLLETIRCEDGVAHHLSYHQQRLDSTLQKLEYSTAYLLSELISPPDERLYRCRFLYDNKGYTIEYLPYTPKPISSLRIVHNNDIDYPLKYADRTELNALFEQRGICNDVVIAKNGNITDTTIANIAFYINHQWLTPDTPLLEGTTRSRLVNEGKIFVAPITISDALNAPRIALLNAMIGFFEMENVIIR